jgi:hypothetical protein
MRYHMVIPCRSLPGGHRELVCMVFLDNNDSGKKYLIHHKVLVVSSLVCPLNLCSLSLSWYVSWKILANEYYERSNGFFLWILFGMNLAFLLFIAHLQYVMSGQAWTDVDFIRFVQTFLRDFVPQRGTPWFDILPVEFFLFFNLDPVTISHIVWFVLTLLRDFVP